MVFEQFMVKNMFMDSKRSLQGKKPIRTYKRGHILAVQPGASLLASKSHQQLLDKIAGMSALPEEYHQQLYSDFLNGFAEFVQVLSVDFSGALLSLLNRSLVQGYFALDAVHSKQGKSIDPLVNYAAFTAGVLMDVNKVMVNFKIAITDKAGKFDRHWQPLSGSLVAQGAKYYKLHRRAAVYQRLDSSLTVLLARQLLPEIGFNWIASDLSIFADWLDALQGDFSRGGRICHVLSLLDYDDLFEFRESLELLAIEQLSAAEVDYGAQFHEWVRDGVEKGDIKVNVADALVHVVAEGVFIDKQLFKQFADIVRMPVSFNVVFQQFGNAIGATIQSQLFAKYISSYPSAKQGSSPFTSRSAAEHSGVVVTDAAMIFQKDVPAANGRVVAAKGAVARSLPALATKSLRSGPAPTA